MLHPDRLLPADPATRKLARQLYDSVAQAPLICPHGHCEPGWFASDTPFQNATTLLITPDHYILRMFASQGITYDALGLPRVDGRQNHVDPRDTWRLFAQHYGWFAGTPTRLWMDHALHEVLGVPDPLSAQTADACYDHINARLAEPAFRPRALLARFNIEYLATTDGATDALVHHQALRDDGIHTIVPTFRPDALTSPLRADFADSMVILANQTGEDVASWLGYLDAVRSRRAFFQSLGATSTDHGVLHPQTLNLARDECQALLTAALAGTLTAPDAARFEAQMLFEMAAMSTEDGLVMQLHAGSRRNYATHIFNTYGADRGFDIPGPAAWAEGLRPLLDAFGFEPNFKLVVYTLDETAYARELAPLAGAFPSVTLGAPWWFYDSPEGLRRYRSAVTETAGFYNTAGFVDDTRGFLSIPARHDMFRRVEAGNLAKLVAEHVLPMNEASAVIHALVADLPRQAYRLQVPA